VSSLPSPTKIRLELERIPLKDLLGPVAGPEEEIDKLCVRDRYLVGMLAPQRQELSPEQFDELPQGGRGSVEDGATESSSLTTKTMFPFARWTSAWPHFAWSVISVRRPPFSSTVIGWVCWLPLEGFGWPRKT